MGPHLAPFSDRGLMQDAYLLSVLSLLFIVSLICGIDLLYFVREMNILCAFGDFDGDGYDPSLHS